MNRNGLTLNPDNSVLLAAEIKKKHLADFNELQKLTRVATENKFYQITRPDVSLLILKCMAAIGNRKAYRSIGHPTVPATPKSGGVLR